MKNFYVVFDQLNMKYGFAPLVGSANLKPAIKYAFTPYCSYTSYYYSSCNANKDSRDKSN